MTLSTEPGNPVERAFELAQTGSYASVTAVSKALKAEGFSHASLEMHLSGRSIRAQLRETCRRMRVKTQPV